MVTFHGMRCQSAFTLTPLSLIATPSFPLWIPLLPATLAAACSTITLADNFLLRVGCPLTAHGPYHSEILRAMALELDTISHDPMPVSTVTVFFDFVSLLLTTPHSWQEDCSSYREAKYNGTSSQ
jgi:hypothetical protein